MVKRYGIPHAGERVMEMADDEKSWGLNRFGIRLKRQLRYHAAWHKRHKAWHKRYEQSHERHREISKQHEELLKLHKEFNLKKAELIKYHQHIKYTRLFTILIILIIWYVIFRFAGIKTVSVSFAFLISIGGIIELMFHARLERSFFLPIARLKKGVEEIAMGNYDVRVKLKTGNEIELLADSFNHMAAKLGESDRIKAEYEENRKALIANISHDLKTPMTSIQGYIEAILDVEAMPVESLRKYLKIISSNTAYMNKLIDDLFLFSKLDMQKLELKLESVGIRPYISDLMEEFKYELEERKIEFVYNDRLQADHPVEIDLKRLQQVFRNIIGNAVKYGSDRRLKIIVSLYDKDGYVCADIENNGPAIPEDKLPYIFDRFYRIDTERTKDEMSTGLGLAIAKELVEAHKGKISVSSIEGAGTCFTVHLPVGG